jgi:hypothetical protein
MVTCSNFRVLMIHIMICVALSMLTWTQCIPSSMHCYSLPDPPKNNLFIIPILRQLPYYYSYRSFFKPPLRVLIDLYFTCIHPLFMPYFPTHLTLPCIKTLDSWLFLITRICTSEYIKKNSRNKMTIHFIIFWYYKKFTLWHKHRIQYRSMCFSILSKTWIKITTKSHVLLKFFIKKIKVFSISK